MSFLDEYIDEVVEVAPSAENDILTDLIDNYVPPEPSAMSYVEDLLDGVVIAPAKAPAAKKPAAKRIEPAKKTTVATTAETVADAKSSAKFTISSMKDHAKKKGMWAGALKPVLIPDLLGAIPIAEAAETDTDDTDTDSTNEMELDEPDAKSRSGKAAKKPMARIPKLKVELVDIERPQTPALLKIMDEILVNATDHAKEYEKAAPSQRVTRIEVDYDEATGRFTVHNDGPGIPVVVHAEASQQSGRDVYVPEVAFAWFLAGTNIDKELSNVKGGINGLGAKLANVHSVRFSVETVDGRHYYEQEWTDRLENTGEPTIIDVRKKGAISPPSKAKPHTKVSFIPAYRELGYRTTTAGALTEADSRDIDAWLRLRTHQAAAYVGDKVFVSYNGERCETTSAAMLGRLLLSALGEEASQALVLSAQAKATEEPYKQHPLNIAIVVLPPGKKAGRRSAAQNMTIVNGVLCNKGSHVQYFKQMLSAAVEEKLRKVMKRGRAAPKSGSATAAILAAKKAGKKAPAAVSAAPEDKKMSITETLAGVRLVMCGAIPGADWAGQRKDELQVEKATLLHYTLSATFLRSVGDAVAERILIAQGSKSGKVQHDKYTRARYAGKAAHKKHTYLGAAEGDSAITLLRAGLTQSRVAAPPGGPSLDWFGIISLQGVIVNAAREVTGVETSAGEIINVRSAKLQNNKRLLALADAFGLDYGRSYTTEEELATLHYGQLLLCVDQDLDGTGKIAALVLVWIYLFWPALLRAGRVGRFMTPLVRAYPKKGGDGPAEFYYVEELNRWLAEDPERSDSHTIKYYKGLATHNKEEVKRMFTPEAFKRSIYTYTMDDAAKKLFEVYFGADAALRKEKLVTPVAHLSYEEACELHRKRQIPVGRVQLDVDTKSYKNDAIKRQIPGAADGLNPARRKIVLGAMMRFASESASKELKIFQLGGYVADKCFYHHGDTSLNGTITYLAQSYSGARQYPYLIGVGMFGSRHGDRAGSARYIAVKSSPFVKAVLPAADRWHLKYVFEDGERAEPQQFVPVMPMAALESYRIVSEGWNHDSYGRDLEAVLAVVDMYVSGDAELLEIADRLHAEGPTKEVLDAIDKLAKLYMLPPSKRGFDGEVRMYRGEAYSFGAYTWDADARAVTITELPIGVSTLKYLETLVKPGRAGKANPRDEFIESIEDRSAEEKVELKIVLRPGAFDTLSAGFGDASIDPIEDALMLRASLRPHLNYYSVNGGVLEFGECYLAPILYWAPLRRALYVERLTRAQIVADLRIVEEMEIIRYIGMAASLDLANIEDDEGTATAILQEHDFPQLNAGLLHRPEYTPNDQLRHLVTAGPGASYNYILDLKERDLVQSSVAKRQKRLEGLREDLATAAAQLAERPIAGASVWRAEIEEFKRTVAVGIETGWTFETKKK